MAFISALAPSLGRLALPPKYAGMSVLFKAVDWSFDSLVVIASILLVFKVLALSGEINLVIEGAEPIAFLNDGYELYFFDNDLVICALFSPVSLYLFYMRLRMLNMPFDSPDEFFL